ncbi:MAG: STAS/SEC14 domain-containing protein [Nitrospirota bacterium]|nr:MAG: STAS/SEC14 domain-containing protein [Nitrospirota bacterium]
MIKILPESKGNIVGARASGTLTDQDYQEVFIPQLEKVIEEKGKVRLLLDLGQDFQGWTLEALWQDAKFGWGSRNNFEKVALVGGSLWMELGAKAGSLLMEGELRTFDRDHLQEAWDWIKSYPKAGEMTQPAPVISIDVAKKEDPIQKESKSAKERSASKTNSHHSPKKTHR